MVFKVGICGTGFVGSAVSTGLETLLGSKIEIREYDKYKLSESLYEVVNNCKILFLCLPTPMDEDGYCDISIVEEVAEKINNLAEQSKIIILKSTVPPGTTEELAKRFKKHSWIFNPEFLTESNFINDFLEQDRIILGKSSLCNKEDFMLVRKLFENFIKKQKKAASILESHSIEAEMTKYAANCFLATKVMFFNEIYEICNSIKLDYKKIRNLVTLDKRIGASHSQVPGPDSYKGFGGACFSKDINALIAFARENDVEPLILESVWAKNLLIREKYDWEDLSQVNGNYNKKEI